MGMRRRRDNGKRLRRLVRTLKAKNDLLQLYPSDRRILKLIRQAGKSLRDAAGDAAATRDIVAGFFDSLPDPPDGGAPSVIISGPVRSGKSTVSKLVCLQSSARYFQFDLIQKLWVDEHKANDESVLDLVLENVCRKYPRGMVIESSSLIFNGRAPAAAMVAYFAGHGIRTVLIGSAEASVDEKVEALVGHRNVKNCWMAGLTEDALRDRAERIVSLSVTARRIAGETGAQYFELGIPTFSRDVRHAVNTIIDVYGFA